MKPTLYVDLDGVLCDIHKQRQLYLKNNPDMKYPQSQYGFFVEMEEIPYSVDSVKMLSKHFDVWFLTAPSTRNPMSYAEKNYWIRLHFGQDWCDKLIICPDKSLLRGEYLVDDNKSGRGQDRFIGTLVQYGTTEHPDWFEVNRSLLASVGVKYETGYEIKKSD